MITAVSFSVVRFEIMRRSNRNFNIPPPPVTSAIRPLSVPGEWGIWLVRPPRGGKFDLCLVGVFLALKSLIVIDKCLDEMEGIQQLAKWLFFFLLLVTELLKEF